jgi:DNA polymerase-3 subunit delta
MMAETKCVLVKDFPLDTLDDSGFEQLETVIADAPDDCALIFAMITHEPKGAKWNKTVKLFEKNAYTVKLDKKTAVELAKTVESGAKKRGKAFEKGVSSYFLTCVGSDLNLLLNELEKVCAYAEGDIKKSDVDAVCTKSLDAKVFDMIRDLTGGKTDSAFKKLNILFEQREDEFQILGALIAQYSDIYRAKAAVKSGERGEAVAKYYNYAGKEFRLSNAARNGSSLSFGDIGECIEILQWADTTLKSSALDKRLILEQVVVRLARVGRG